jgi:large subunit ribosomal protein L22
MEFTAKACYIRFSPEKLRLLVEAIRGKRAQYAMNWLSIKPIKRALPIKKMIESAVANAKDLQNVDASSLVIKEIRVDRGPVYRYYKPGAMGRTNAYKKRLSHMSVVLESEK